MTEKDLDFRIWQTKLYILQRDAPSPHMIACTKELAYRPPQYGLEYHGPISRQETERLLEDAPDGAYLIRESQRAPNTYTLVIRFDNVAKNYMLFYDAERRQHYVGEKCFDTVEMLVADGLIHFNVETRGADVLRKMAEINTYEKTPFYRMRYHTFNAGQPNPNFERLLNQCVRPPCKPLPASDSVASRDRFVDPLPNNTSFGTSSPPDSFPSDHSHPLQPLGGRDVRVSDVVPKPPPPDPQLNNSILDPRLTIPAVGNHVFRTRPPPAIAQFGGGCTDPNVNSDDVTDVFAMIEPPVPPVRSTSGSQAKHCLSTDNAASGMHLSASPVELTSGEIRPDLVVTSEQTPTVYNTNIGNESPAKVSHDLVPPESKRDTPTLSPSPSSDFCGYTAAEVAIGSGDETASFVSESDNSSSTVSPDSSPWRHPRLVYRNGVHVLTASSELVAKSHNAPECDSDDSQAVLNLMERYRLPTVCLATDQPLPVDTERRKHNFKVHTYRGPHWCDFCTHFIWGLVAQGVKCADCGFQAHKRCSDLVPDDCLPDIKQMKRVFGVDLIGLTLAERKPIPTILERCVEEIEKRGALESEGLYRVPGNHDRIEQARSAFDKNSETAALSPSRIPDVNVITSLIKAFLRQLPVPLITYDAYPKLMDIIRNGQLSEADKLTEISGVLSTLPAAHYESLRFFLRHIHRVASNHKQNMMSVQNLAVVLAPSLMSSSYSDPLSCLTGMKFEHSLVELLIREYTRLFPPFDRFNRRSSALNCHSQSSPHQPVQPTSDRPTSQCIQFLPSPESISSADIQIKRRFVKHRRSIDTGLLTSQPVTSGVLNATSKPFPHVNMKF